jgi:hypothetical protein
MTYPTTDVEWVDADVDLPSKVAFGPYPRAIVALQYVEHPEYGYSQQFAELRYLGKQLNRPVWLDIFTLKPIENETKIVRYWTPRLTPPNN